MATILLKFGYLLFVTLPLVVWRVFLVLVSVVGYVAYLLGLLLSPLLSLLSPVATLLAPYLSPRHVNLSISFDLIGLFKGLVYIGMVSGVWYLWRYVWGGRYSRLPATDPKVRFF